MNSNEVDISSTVSKVIKFGLIAMVLLGFCIASIVWMMESGSSKMVIQDAKVATDMVGVRAQTDGVIEELLVQEGDLVEAGTVVAKLKVNVTPEQIQQLEQTVELSRRNLDQVRQGSMVSVPVTPMPSSLAANANVANARKRLERMNQLLEMGAISTAERDAAAADLAAAEAAAPAVSEIRYETRFQPSSPEVIRNAEMALRQAEMALELAKNSAQGTEIVTEVAGTVYLRDLQTGSEVQSGQVILNVGDAESLWVEAHVGVEQQEKIRLGDLAYCNIDGNEYKGTVMDIVLPEDEAKDGNTEGGNGQADETSAEAPQKLTVKISIPPQAIHQVRPEQRAEVTLGK